MYKGFVIDLNSGSIIDEIDSDNIESIKQTFLSRKDVMNCYLSIPKAMIEPCGAKYSITVYSG